MWIKNCQECKKEFITNINSQVYCSSECRKEGIKKWRTNYQTNYWKTHKEQYDKNQNQRKQKDNERRKIVLTHYGGNPPKCACCGEVEIRFLELDHINGGGREHRRQLFCGRSIGGNLFYRWLIENNFPEGYQVLCCNCNMVKRSSKVRFCKVHHPELYEGIKNVS